MHQRVSRKQNTCNGSLYIITEWSRPSEVAICRPFYFYFLAGLNRPSIQRQSRYNVNLTGTKLSFRSHSYSEIMKKWIKSFNIRRNICFGYLLESPPKHTFHEKNENKSILFLHIILLIKDILQHKLILIAKSSGANAVVVTRVHYIKWLIITLTRTVQKPTYRCDIYACQRYIYAEFFACNTFKSSTHLKRKHKVILRS